MMTFKLLLCPQQLVKSTHRAFAVNLPTDLLTVIPLCGTVKAIVKVTLMKKAG